MAPNLTSGTIHSKDIKDIVRTEFVAQNVYGYLLQNEYFVKVIPPQNSTEKATIEAFKDVVDVFKSSYATSMAELSATLDVTPETLNSVHLGVSNELFCEGINWSKIATYFVFASELSIQCLRKNFPESVIEETLNCCLQFVQDSLQKWINDHNGWEGIIAFASGHKDKITQSLQNVRGNSKRSGWAKSAIYGTVKVLGTLAHLATLADPASSFPMNSRQE